jgi:hypothetical protein
MKSSAFTILLSKTCDTKHSHPPRAINYQLRLCDGDTLMLMDWLMELSVGLLLLLEKLDDCFLRRGRQNSFKPCHNPTPTK